MSNTLLTIGQITQEALMVLENELTFTKLVNREYDDQFAKKGAKIGDTVNVRKPVRYIGRRTATLSVENTGETSVPVTMTTQYGTDVSFTSAELTLSMDDFSDRVLKPAVANISNMIDADGMALYTSIYNHVGTVGTTPSTNLTYLNAGALLDTLAVPRDSRNFVISPQAHATIANANLALFNPQGKISEQYIKGMFGKNTLGGDFYMDQNVGMQTVGTYAANVTGGAVTVNGAVTTGSTVVMAGWTSGDILNKGDIITFGNVYSVNPQNRTSTGNLQQFVVTAAATATGGGAMTVVVSPSVVFSGANQNVTSATNSIATSAAVRVYGAPATLSAQNLLFHKDAFTFVTADLEMPPVVNAKRVTSKKLGMSIRLVPFYDGINDRTNYRLDLLGGWSVLRPELACRISGANL